MKVELLTITPDAERLIEQAGRTAYQSFDKQAPGSERKFIRMLVKLGHTSVLEHAWATFRISGVSRTLTHQLVRHRLCSFTQASQRYVNEKNFGYVTPGSIEDRPEALKLFDELMAQARRTYTALQELGVPNEDARFTLPNAVNSEIVVSANLREWRHIITLRGHRAAQWEIRLMALEILKILKRQAPSVFEDLEVDEERQAIRERAT